MNPATAHLLRIGRITPDLEKRLRDDGLLAADQKLTRQLWLALNEWLETRPLPIAEWPDWALALADYRLPDDSGVGDTVEKTIGLFGSDTFKFWFHQTFGHNRHCPKCPAKWNRLYPYS